MQVGGHTHFLPDIHALQYWEDPCQFVFTATLGLIKVVSVSGLRYELRTSAIAGSVFSKGGSWAPRATCCRVQS